jgi:hypothetical protein
VIAIFGVLALGLCEIQILADALQQLPQPAALLNPKGKWDIHGI